MTRLVDAGLRYGIATLGVTAVGKGHGARREVFPPGVPHVRGTGRAGGEDLLMWRKGLKRSRPHARLPVGDGGRQEAAGVTR